MQEYAYRKSILTSEQRSELIDWLLKDGRIYPGLKIAERVYGFLRKDEKNIVHAELIDWSSGGNCANSRESTIENGIIRSGNLQNVDHFLGQLRWAKLYGEQTSQQNHNHRQAEPIPTIISLQNESFETQPDKIALATTIPELAFLSNTLKDRITNALVEIGIANLELPIEVVKRGLLTNIDRLVQAIELFDGNLPPNDGNTLSHADYIARSGNFNQAAIDVQNICKQSLTVIEQLLSSSTSNSIATNGGILAALHVFLDVSEAVTGLLNQTIWEFNPSKNYVPEFGDQIHEFGTGRIIVSTPEYLAQGETPIYNFSSITRNFGQFSWESRNQDSFIVDPEYQIIRRGPGAYIDLEEHVTASHSVSEGNRLIKLLDTGEMLRGEVLGLGERPGSQFTVLFYDNTGLPMRIETLELPENGGISSLGLVHAPEPTEPMTLTQKLMQRFGVDTSTLTQAIEFHPDTGPNLAGLEALCRLIRSVEYPIFVRVNGDIRDRNFDGPLEPRWLRHVDGFLTTGSDLVALNQCCFSTSGSQLSGDDFLDALESGTFELLGKQTAAYSRGIETYLSGSKNIFGENSSHPMSPVRLGQLVTSSHPSITTDRLVIGTSVAQKVEDLITLGTILSQHGCRPVMISYAGSPQDAVELSAAIEAGWEVILIRNTRWWSIDVSIHEASQKAIALIELARSRDAKAYPNVHIVDCSWTDISNILKQVGRLQAQKLQEIVKPNPAPKPTSVFMSKVQQWAETLETNLAHAAQRLSDSLIEQEDSQNSLTSVNTTREFAVLTRGLKRFHKDIEAFLQICKAPAMQASINNTEIEIAADCTGAFDAMKAFIEANLAKNRDQTAIIKKIDRLEKSLAAIYSRFSLNDTQPVLPSSYQTELSGKDLLRISEIMQMSNHGLHGCAGPLHGFTYGDMSKDRFADFIRKGARVHTVRINGEIAGFFMDAPPAFMEQFKPIVSTQFGDTGVTAAAIAVAIDPRSAAHDSKIYEKLRNSVILHQLRGPAIQILGRVHPRNIRAISTHISRGGFQLSPVADEDVAGLRFVSMFIDLNTVMKRGIRPATASVRNKAFDTAMQVFFEDMPGRNVNSATPREQYLATAPLLDLIGERMHLWGHHVWRLEQAYHNDQSNIKDLALQVSNELKFARYSVRPDNIDLVDNALDHLVSTPIKENWEKFIRELSIAIGSRHLLDAFDLKFDEHMQSA